ncbi:FadR/GntR family transcriptional regulator [Mycolicibacterium brumae]|uniref:FadR family transcriptional regulator n=1 Tax=Mycolicibacterium brumae TaxID=85968 RepID=A0A2G5PHB0_9MYCO|nr:GntR family transcriptional regulator [Mycolicibacterium brumae]MCV7194497.1 FadR family transcriptional regulator [Mycolicibacterium brumae]PIB77698.1 FadR family transcriptional regulator [Mycolicibacterium brumae]RWA20104.1 hypothetical protein MBRU_15840 [Mycolicibacterium brumae DSM 44177]UWW10032.1 GntR family transcriptional regulator [Mycolicibacterium brumae]
MECDIARREPAAPLSNAPRAKKAVDGAIDALRSDIVSGQVAQGARLPSERDLAAHYGVSQPTIREAVRALAAMGLIEVRHGSGAYVRGDSDFLMATALRILLQMKDVGLLEALDVRTALGLQSARAAALAADESDLAALEDAYRALDDVSGLADHSALIGAVAGFQIALSRAGRNELTSAIETVLISLIMQMQLKALRSRGIRYWQDQTVKFQSDRMRILEAVREGDPEAAAAAMAGYLNHQRQYFTADEELATLRLSDPRAVRVLDELSPRSRR